MNNSDENHEKYYLLHKIIKGNISFHSSFTSITTSSPTVPSTLLYTTNSSSSTVSTSIGCPIISSLKQFEILYSTIHAYLACTVCLFGTGTNFLNSIILTQEQMRNPTNALLTGIAIVDSLTMLAYGSQVIYLHFLTSPYPEQYPHSQLAVYLILLNHAISIGSHTISTCLLVQLAAFRCWVLYSSKLKYLLSLHHNSAWIMINSQKRFILYCYVSAGIIGCILCMPTFILYQCELIDVINSPTNYNNITGNTMNIKNHNDSSNNIMITDQYFYWFKLRHGGQLLERLHFIVYGCFVKILASILIVIFTVFILMVLHDARQRYRKLQTLPIEMKLDHSNITNNTINYRIINNNNNVTLTRRISSNLLRTITRTNTSDCNVPTKNSEPVNSNCIHQTSTNVTTVITTKSNSNLMSTLPLTTTKNPLSFRLYSITPSNEMRSREFDNGDNNHNNNNNNNDNNTHNNRNAMTNNRRHSSRLLQKSRESQRITIMLIIVVISFVITEAPQGLFNTLVAIKGECFLHTIYLPLGDLLDLLVLLNSSINFILYCAMSQVFRVNFVNLLKKFYCTCC
ncbi:unnamed protein product, partial [Schistosoma turkestanicum]